MSEPFEFPNDSEDERAANKEEETLAARDTWIGIANSTTHHLKVATFNEYVREKQSGGQSAAVSVEGLPVALELQAEKKERELEMGKRLPDGTTVDIIPEVYEKIRVPGDNILKSKLVEIKIFKVENGDSEPKLLCTKVIKVKHGLIVIKDENEPDGLKVIPAKGQFWEVNRWKPHKNWKAANKKETYDPIQMMLEA